MGRAIAMEFRPARPSLRDWRSTAFLALLLVVLAPRLAERPTPGWLAGLAGLALLVAGGSWMILRHRFPGRPVLRVDGEGLRYLRSGREQRLSWDAVAAIEVLGRPRDELRFMAVAGAAAIVTHKDMVAADGQYFVGRIEDYWRPPGAKRSSR